MNHFGNSESIVPEGAAEKASVSAMRERRLLHSWKEIASYVNLGIRTVQRYETYLHFPVHRPAGKSPSAVFAFCDEVDLWLSCTPTRNGKRQSGQWNGEAGKGLESIESELRTRFLSIAGGSAQRRPQTAAIYKRALQHCQEIRKLLIPTKTTERTQLLKTVA